jgi:hypothetical protein
LKKLRCSRGNSYHALERKKKIAVPIVQNCKRDVLKNITSFFSEFRNRLKLEGKLPIPPRREAKEKSKKQMQHRTLPTQENTKSDRAWSVLSVGETPTCMPTLWHFFFCLRGLAARVLAHQHEEDEDAQEHDDDNRSRVDTASHLVWL